MTLRGKIHKDGSAPGPKCLPVFVEAEGGVQSKRKPDEFHSLVLGPSSKLSSVDRDAVNHCHVTRAKRNSIKGYS